jgi:aminoglycoside 6'-N-acetyltransferase
MQREDLRLLHSWLQREHVQRWWSKRESYEEVVEHYLPAIEGSKPTVLYLILLEERPVGFIQSYLVSDYPPYGDLVAVGEGVAGVDLFIAEPELVGRGLGSEALRCFVRDVIFVKPALIACIADPDVRNLASIRAFEKAGFRAVSDVLDPADGEMHRLMRLDRGAG